MSLKTSLMQFKMKTRCGTQRLMLMRKIKSCLGKELRIYLDSRMVCIIIYYAMNDFHLTKNYLMLLVFV